MSEPRTKATHPNDAPTRASILPDDPTARKRFPVASGVLDYFPDALVAIAEISFEGNEQHNPGEPLHWARGKSTDQDDTIIRHFLQRGTWDVDPKTGKRTRHSAKMAWRCLALLQLEIEAEQAAAAQQYRQCPEMFTQGSGINLRGYDCEREEGHSGPHDSAKAQEDRGNHLSNMQEREAERAAAEAPADPPDFTDATLEWRGSEGGRYYRDGKPACNHTGRKGYYCTLPKGHVGNHIATDTAYGDTPAETWGR